MKLERKSFSEKPVDRAGSVLDDNMVMPYLKML
jgi:hypothetical protein